MASILGDTPLSLFLALQVACSTIVVYFVWKFVYTAYFDELSQYPGPLLWRATYFPYLSAVFRGQVPFEVKLLHDKYGPVVRINPRELSYRNAQAWKDIYASRPGHVLPEKHPVFYNPASGAHNIVSAPHAHHGLIRRNVAHAFSDKALREQEPLISGYVDLLITRLRARAGTTVDMRLWYNCTTFDITGDLTFGKPFGCLQSSDLVPWIKLQADTVSFWSKFMAVSYLPLGSRLMSWSAGEKLKQLAMEHIRLTSNAVRERLETRTERPDFFKFMLENEIKGLDRKFTFEELVSNAALFITAGSETTATLLSGLTYYLLRNPDVYKKLCDEVRGAFKSEADINMATCSNLDYMLACLDEALRLFPPVPGHLPRIIPPGGAYINGEMVPANTTVSCLHYGSYMSDDHFKDSEQFIPERWLGDAEYAQDDRKAFYPFLLGPRVCLGRSLAYFEMRLIVARILWNFDMELCEDSVDFPKQKVHTMWEGKELNVVLSLRT